MTKAFLTGKVCERKIRRKMISLRVFQRLVVLMGQSAE